MSFTTHNTFLFYSAILCLVPETLALETLLDRGCYSKFLDLENYAVFWHISPPEISALAKCVCVCVCVYVCVCRIYVTFADSV